MSYRGRIAGTTIPWEFWFPETWYYLRNYLTDDGNAPSEAPVSVTDEEFSDWEQAGNAINAFAEFCLLCQQTSEFLLRNDSCIFHAAALSAHGRGWLIAAGSGVGKSTLCQTLTEAYPEAIQVINGDKPALRYEAGSGIIIHPSPWTGKEGWHGAGEARLAGVFLLRRGAGNRLLPAVEADAASRIYMSVFQSFNDEDVMRLAAQMAEHILESAPVWSLTTSDPAETAKLVYLKMREVCRDEL